MKSYLKFLSRNKLYTAIEAVGLAVSLAFVILIGSYVVQQYEVAHESPQWKRTFVLGSDEFLGLTYWDKEELEMNIPEVQAATGGPGGDPCRAVVAAGHSNRRAARPGGRNRGRS